MSIDSYTSTILAEKPEKEDINRALLDLLKKINTTGQQAGAEIDSITSDVTDLEAQITAETARAEAAEAALDASKQDNLNIILDYRATSGGTRTETVIALEVGQIALVFWQLQRSSGTVTFGLPSAAGGGDTYEVSLSQGVATVASDSLVLASAAGVIMTGGSAAGGSTVAIMSTTASNSIQGFVRRKT